MASDTTVKFRADISSLKAGMQAAQRSIRLATSEFNKSTASLDNWSKSEQGLEEKVKQLNKILEAQRKQVDLANEEWEKTKKVFGENSAEADRAKMRLNQYETQVARTEKELKEYESELTDCKNKTGAFADETGEAAAASKKMSDGYTLAKGILADFVASGVRYAISALKDLATEAVKTGMEFEASMSKVKAISGANAEQMQALTDKAKEMGEKTVFSASEASQAFQYMAMAGWKTEDMLDGIEGIMNLAAASGEDLATTSDIVTDALTAFGLKASDAGRFADVMAAAASNANTNVSMMGESFKYVAPLAGSMGYKVEDVATALGLMANAGVKSSNAGTALRTLLTNMANPTYTMAKAMGTLGLSLEDGEGNMKSLSEIMQDMRKGFGQLKMSAQDYDKELTILDDSLEQGSLTQKEYNKKAAELRERAFGAEGALKAQAAAQLAGARGLSGLMAIVNASDEDFGKLTTAINDSTGAAQEMADTMTDNVSGQLTLLKSKVEGIMIKLFERASGSMRGGIERVSEALDSVDWDKVGDAVGEFAGKVLDFFTWIIKNADVILETLKSVAKVMLTIWAVKKVSQWANAINGAITVFKAFTAAIKAGESAMTAAETAGGLFAKLISPGGAIVLGIAAVVAVTASLISIFSEEEQAIKVLNAEQEENIQKSAEMVKAYEDLEAARQESMEAVNGEYRRYEELKGELDSLVDANGKVKTGYEERVAFIINELNNALGTELEMTDGVIKNYQAEKKSIDELIESKRAEAILSANEAAYTEAYAKRAEAAEQYAKAQNDFNDTLARAQSMQGEYNAIMAETDRIMNTEGITAAAEYQEAHRGVIDTYAALQQAVTETRASLKNASDAYEGYNQTIKNYEGLSSAIIAGDQQKIEEALLRTENALKDHSNATADELEVQAETYRNKYDEMKRAIEEGNTTLTKDDLENARKLAELTEKEYEKSGKQSLAGYHKGITDAQSLDEIKKDSANIGETTINSLNEVLREHSPSRATYDSGVNFIMGFVNALSDKESLVYKKAYEIAQTAVKALKKGQDEHSPSKITFKSGVNFVKGFINGIASMTQDLTATVKKTIGAALKIALGDKGGNFAEVGESAAKAYTNALSEKSAFMLNKIQYQNEQKIKEFDATISKLQSALSKKQSALQKKIDATDDEKTKKKLKAQSDALKKQYDKQIEAQNKAKTAYQTASSKMLSEYQTALNEYQQKASALVQNTINGIADKYEKEYNNLVEKQEALATKLKTASTLFDISGAGVMTINDITEQTKSIKQYAKKLQTIKNKVSSGLFDEIAGLDMKEGEAFIDRLLAMSDKELKAYSNAYNEKMAVSEKLAEKTYKKDIKATEKAYDKELKAAFKKLPDELEKLGADTMKGFLSGLTKDTSYMSKEIKTFVKSMVSTFEKELKTTETKKATEGAGKKAGNTVISGLKTTAKKADKAAKGATSSIVKTTEGAGKKGSSAFGDNITNNYNLVQNNNSPKPLTALETFRARRRQVELVKALT